MEEKITIEESQNKEYITEKEAKAIKELFSKYLKSYKEKDKSVSDKEWLEQLLVSELPEVQVEEAEHDAVEIMNAINEFDGNLKSINEASKKGISKESWLANKTQELSVGMAVNEYGQVLQSMDDILYQKNMELSDALQRSSDGHIKMSPNLDGNIAENMIAKTAELSGLLQGKNIKIDVRDVFTENSVDIKAINLDTGKYHNYQLKFGKDAKATIELIERGNYNNQQLIVPSEQLEEVQAHFKSKGSLKTISDHIDAWGAKGKRFTKEDMKELQLAAQEEGNMPRMDYSHYQTKDLAMSIGKNAGALALQAAAVTTGLNIANKMFNGEKVDADEMVEIAISTGADTSVKVVTAGTLQVAIRKGIIRFIPKATSSDVIANIACVAIENVKILYKITAGELSITKGLDQMGRITISMVAGLCGMALGSSIGAKLTKGIPVVGAPLAVITGFVGGMVGYSGGSKIGEKIYDSGKKLASRAMSVAKTAVKGLERVGRVVTGGAKKIFNKIFS